VNKPIRTETDYEAALAAVEELMDLDPADGTPAADQLELLTLLVQDYEARVCPPEVVGPIDAIQFRMEQLGLSPRDLIPYIGSRSKVSEVLSGKRQLTLPMIRALHDRLGVPLEPLLQAQDPSQDQGSPVEWDRFPLREMIRRGWVDAREASTDAEAALKRFFSPLGSPSVGIALYRKANHVRSARTMDQYALAAWTARVVNRASEKPLPRYEPGTVSTALVHELLRNSRAETGPTLAVEFLKERGIGVIFEPHLARTHLDGAAIRSPAGNPVVGLTLRHDRVDYFWFCLVHELAHIALHLGAEVEGFYDDLDVDDQGDAVETEADNWAGEALIPAEVWRKSPASVLRSPEAVQDLADSLGIHPAIVAGRMRHVYKNYRLLNHLVGLGQVRKLFSETNGSE
jgi:HTH-type transcriptional regulator/antitoxin HigA